MSKEKLNDIPLSFYAVIPTNILIDNGISPAARLFYVAISALTQKNGYCWAHNSYFADLFSMSERHVRRYIKELENMNCIYVEIENNNKRKIYLADGKISPKINSDRADIYVQGENNRADIKPRSGRTQDVHHNNKELRDLSNISSSSSKISDPSNKSSRVKPAMSDSEKRKIRKEARKEKLTTYPTNFSLEESTLSGIREKYPSLTNSDIKAYLSDFTDYYSDGNGIYKKYVNWQAAFRDWVKRNVRFYGKTNGNGNGHEVSQRAVPPKGYCKECEKVGKNECWQHMPGGSLDKWKERNKKKIESDKRK